MNEQMNHEPTITPAERKRARDAAYRAAHREEKRAYNAAYLAANREKERARKAAYRADHREEQRAYDAARREEKRAYYVAYSAARPEKGRAKTAKRRAVKLKQRCTCCTDAQIEEFHAQAVLYGGHVDHIVQLALGGHDCAKNLQALTDVDHIEKTKIDARLRAEARRRSRLLQSWQVLKEVA